MSHNQGACSKPIAEWSSIWQSGMGVGVSNWRLAREVARLGHIGTVSLVGIAHVLARRLQYEIDVPEIWRACQAFPVPNIAERLFDRYYRHPEAPIPKITLTLPKSGVWLNILGAFTEVWLAKEGHNGIVTANTLAKVDMPILPILLGAIWAGVNRFVIGAGLPFAIPQALRDLVAGREAVYPVEILTEVQSGETSNTRRFKKEVHCKTLNIEALIAQEGGSYTIPTLKLPAFIPIVSLELAARLLEREIRKANPDGIDGYYIEDPKIAGGHISDPRGGGVTGTGEPLYTEKDRANLDYFRKLRRPFWLAGGQASPKALNEARALGAQGIACGSIFALAEESPLMEGLKRVARWNGYLGMLDVRVSEVASPTGYYFRVAQLPETLADPSLYAARERSCIIGCLQTPVVPLRQDGKAVMSYRCAGEPITDYVRKGGNPEDALGRMCLCEGLLTAVGLGLPGQYPVVTLGNDRSFLPWVMDHPEASYTARDAIRYLLGE